MSKQRHALLTVTHPSSEDIATLENMYDLELKQIKGFKEAWVSRCGKIVKLHYSLSEDPFYYFSTISTRRDDQSHIFILKGIDKNHTKTLSHVVAQAFIMPPEDGERHVIDWKDGDRANNHADNLLWRPCLDGVKHYFKVTDSRDGSEMEFLTKKEFHSWVERTFTFKKIQR